jgi:hypothetical protein
LKYIQLTWFYQDPDGENNQGIDLQYTGSEANNKHKYLISGTLDAHYQGKVVPHMMASTNLKLQINLTEKNSVCVLFPNWNANLIPYLHFSSMNTEIG